MPQTSVMYRPVLHSPLYSTGPPVTHTHTRTRVCQRSGVNVLSGAENKVLLHHFPYPLCSTFYQPLFLLTCPPHPTLFPLSIPPSLFLLLALFSTLASSPSSPWAQQAGTRQLFKPPGIRTTAGHRVEKGGGWFK